MPETFTPLTPALLARKGGLGTPAAQAPAPESARFEPLALPANSPAGPTASGSCTPKPIVTLQRAGNVVTSIRVECTCGQVIELNCQF